ncbi:hypothetical protein KFZ76_07165 [Methylovulum psychrotolerans]|uniref:hypothetical protein n=1 Tax=Methylovulum psychrotolerans TaxID=1704499 RepID=UPI001BFF19A3|nr:hypothetical protein [Methylovulum psychrotolerans]MBT9097491.1 hypothetical protein [Methylovulum psychrotolerans]
MNKDNCAQYVNQEAFPLPEGKLYEAFTELLPFFYKYHQIDAKKPELKKDKAHWMRWAKHWLDEFGDENIGKFKTIWNTFPAFINKCDHYLNSYNDKHNDPIVMPTAFSDNTNLPASPTAQAEPASLADMTMEEALEAHNSLKGLQKVARKILLDIKDRNGWKVLGHDSFGDYAEKEWGYSQAYAYRLAAAAEVEATIDSPLGELPETYLRPLASIPKEDRQLVFDTALANVEKSGKRLTAQFIKDAVNDYKNQLEQANKEIGQLKTKLDDQDQRIYALAEAEINKKLPEIEERLTQDFQANIEGKEDEIMRLRADLKQLQNKSITGVLNAEMDNLTAQIAKLQTNLGQLKSQYAQEYTAEKIDEAYRKVIAQIIEDVTHNANDLKFIVAAHPNHEPSKALRSLYSVAITLLADTHTSIEFLNTKKPQDEIMVG